VSTTPHQQVLQKLTGQKLIGKFPSDTSPEARNTNECPSMKKELARLERNKDRRLAREKAKERQAGIKNAPADGDSGSPSANPLPSTERPTGTTRKCANCGQTGHIKTNKKYEKPLLPQFSKKKKDPKTVPSSILK